MKQEHSTRRAIGNKGEDAACCWLEQQGFLILRRNFTIRGGEIDIIAQEGEYLAFIEVKTRKENSMVSAAESVTPVKQKRIVKTAAAYLYANPSELQPRFDVIEVITKANEIKEIHLLRAAFDTTDMNIIF